MANNDRNVLIENIYLILCDIINSLIAAKRNPIMDLGDLDISE